MTTATGDFELSADELRVVARYVAEAAQDLLPVFEDVNPGDPRPRAALDAAWMFVHGAPRTRVQRVTSLAAPEQRRGSHRSGASCRASRRDAASAAYLHPIAKAHQVGHILRAAANAARIAEISAGGDVRAAEHVIQQARDRATPVLIEVLRRYPRVPAGKSRAAQLMAALDEAVRASR